MEPAAVNVNVYEPLIHGSTQVDTVDRPEDYTHTIQLFGGFHTAQFNLAANWNIFQDWVTNGLGRRIESYGGSTEVCWEGFVNSIRADWGPMTIDVGPMLDIVNRLKVFYAGVDVSVFPPIFNVTSATDWADDEDSQERWGIFPRRYSMTRGSAADATDKRDLLLARLATLKKKMDWNSANERPGNVRVEALGYQHLLTYPYNNPEVTGRQNASAKVTNILTGTDPATAADYNLNSSWLPFDTTYVDENTEQVIQYEDGDKGALQVIRDTTMKGDGANRWTFGVYEERRAYYRQVPSEAEYVQYVTERAKRILSVYGHEIKPWYVRPGKLVEFADLYDDDPQLVDSVTYRAPDRLQFTTIDPEDLAQLMTAYGIRGMA